MLVLDALVWHCVGVWMAWWVCGFAYRWSVGLGVVCVFVCWCIGVLVYWRGVAMAACLIDGVL